MVIIYKYIHIHIYILYKTLIKVYIYGYNKKTKYPKRRARPDWALLKGGQMYRVHMGKSCAGGVLCCARDL